MLVYIGAAVIVAIIVIGFIYTYKRHKAINENGIEAEAVVSRVKENESEDADGNRTVDYDYFVKYRNEAGEIVEAKLGNPPRFIAEGSQLRVKYLKEKPKYVLMVKR